jgi:hypothetical protein
MKWLKPPAPDRPVKRSKRAPAPHGGPLPGQDRQPGASWRGEDEGRRRKKKKRKKREPLWKKALEEAFDVIEDIFD